MSHGPAPSRRSVLGAGVAGLVALTGCTQSAPQPAPQPAQGTPEPARHRYGARPAQHGDLYLPHTGPPRGTVVVIHGGFWQSIYSSRLGAATSADLAQRGWAAWNIEYRRLGNGGGWPTTFADVAAAIDHLSALDVPTEHVVTLGHSSGGHLAAWAASRRGSSLPGGSPRVRVTATVPQAGVLDLTSAARTGLGGTAVPDLLGALPSQTPARYREADPARRLPIGVPIRCVHGRADTTVPISQSRTFADAARKAGDDAELLVVPGDHYALIDPSTAAWRRTVGVLETLAPR